MRDVLFLNSVFITILPISHHHVSHQQEATMHMTMNHLQDFPEFVQDHLSPLAASLWALQTIQTAGHPNQN